MNQKFLCRICLKNVARSKILLIVTFVIYGFISNATTSQNIAIGNFKKIRIMEYKKCINNAALFSQLSGNQIKILMLGSLITSSKQIIQKKPNDFF